MQIGKPTQEWQLLYETEWPTSVVFLANSRQLVVGNRLGQILVWELPEEPPEVDPTAQKDKKDGVALPNCAPVRQLIGHTNAITRLCVTPDRKTLISASLDHTIRLWDVNAPPSGKHKIVLDPATRDRRSQYKSEEQKKEIHDEPPVEVSTVDSTHVLQGHGDWIKALGISGDGKRLISGDDSCLSIVWDLASRKEISRWRGHDRVWVRSAALSPKGDTAFTCEYAGRRSSFDVPAAQARLWNVGEGTPKLDLLKAWTPKTKDESRVDSYGYWQTWKKVIKRGLVCAEFSPNGEFLALGQGGHTDTGKVHIVQVKNGEILRTVSGHQSGVCDVKFSADGKYILSCGRDTTVRISQVSDGKEVAVLGKPRGGQFKDWFHSLAISPDQNYVAAADIGGMVHIWRL